MILYQSVLWSFGASYQDQSVQRVGTILSSANNPTYVQPNFRIAKSRKMKRLGLGLENKEKGGCFCLTLHVSRVCECYFEQNKMN